MALPRTEQMHPAAKGLDAMPGPAALGHLLAQQAAALASLAPALPSIEQAAQMVAEVWRTGGRIAYAGAGSSALMAMADGMELPGTYGLPAARVLLFMAGGLPVDARMPGDTEDDAREGARAGATLRKGDVAITVSASGATPFAVAFAEAARAAGARIVAIANNRDAALFGAADVAICLETPPEVVAGSTRMGAGTAQKACLNLISTRAAILAGQVHDGMMVGLVADNRKLAARAEGMVARIAGCDAARAADALRRAGMAVKPAVLIARGHTADSARSLLSETDDNLREALARTETTAAVPVGAAAG